MIRYERQESHDGAQRAVMLITDDANAEMAALEEIIRDGEFETIKLPKERNEDGNFSFLIPGNEVGEFFDYIYEIDDGQLDDLCDRWNREMLEEQYDE